jgi:O-antigen/teichoic acid export membrane protein
MLVGGTAFAQGLLAVSLPITTRLYSPAQFNLLAVYTAVLGVLSVVSCLRLEIAIPLPDADEEALNLAAVAVAAALLLSLTIGVVGVLIPQQLVSLVGQPGFAPYLWMVPVGVALSSVYMALQYWASRQKRFGLITSTRMTRAVSGAGIQVGFGAVHASPFGLLLGHMAYNGIGVVGLIRSVWVRDRHLLRTISPGAMARAVKTYRRFPQWSVPEALLNVCGVQIPILIIAAVAAGPEAGYLMLAMRAMGLPMALIGGSVAQVYLAEAGQHLRDGTLAAFTRKTMFSLAKLGTPFLIVAGGLSPFLFPIVFGEEWRRAGVILAWLTPYFVFQFVASPISMLLHIASRSFTAMMLQLFGFLSRIGAVLLAMHYAPHWIVEVYAVAGALFYIAYIGVLHFAAGALVPKMAPPANDTFTAP